MEEEEEEVVVEDEDEDEEEEEDEQEEEESPSESGSGALAANPNPIPPHSAPSPPRPAALPAMEGGAACSVWGMQHPAMCMACVDHGSSLPRPPSGDRRWFSARDAFGVRQ